MGLQDIARYIKQGQSQRVKFVLGSSSIKFEGPSKFFLRSQDKNQAISELRAVIGEALHVYPANVKVESVSAEGSGYSAKIYVSFH